MIGVRCCTDSARKVILKDVNRALALSVKTKCSASMA